MSSYNENLNASVVASLQAQELKLNNTQTSLNANMFTLYYAEDAKITAQEKLEQANINYNSQGLSSKEAVANKDLSTNLLATANQGKESNSQSVANTAVAAANVQIATNAITKLASDMGSIVSILNAADYGSQIYEQAIAVNQLMNDTAYNAEMTSQLAMEASYLTSEITLSSVANNATETNNLIVNLGTTLSNQLTATTALMASDSTTFDTACTTQKKAEGTLIDTDVEYAAAIASYIATNKDLNLNLQVTNKSNTGFTVQFSPYLNPFNYSNETDSSNYNSPVENYYVFVVKESEKSTFSLSMAEGLITNSKIAIPVTTNQTATQIEIEIEIANYLDSNQDPIKLGENYVVFVFAQFTLNYKKALNNFEDFLTAASSSFVLKNQLNSPHYNSIKVSPLNKEENSSKKLTNQKLEFKLNKKEEQNIEYRCIFLPDNSNLVAGMFNKADLQKLQSLCENEIKNEENSETSLSKYNSQLEILHEKLNQLNIQISSKKETNSNKKETTSNSEKTIATEDITQKNVLEKQVKELNIQIKNLKEKIKNHSNKSDQNNSYRKIKPVFFFNKLIAESVTYGNYTLAKIEIKTKEQKDLDSKLSKIIEELIKKLKTTDTVLKIDSKLINSILDVLKMEIEKEKIDDFLNIISKIDKNIITELERIKEDIYAETWNCDIQENTTDNFGTPLIEDNKYIPVILTIANGAVSSVKQYSNSLSDFEKTESFKYISKKTLTETIK